MLDKNNNFYLKVFTTLYDIFFASHLQIKLVNFNYFIETKDKKQYPFELLKIFN